MLKDDYKIYEEKMNKSIDKGGSLLLWLLTQTDSCTGHGR